MTQELSSRLHDVLVNSVGNKVKVIASGVNSIKVRDLKSGVEYGLATSILKDVGYSRISSKVKSREE